MPRRRKSTTAADNRRRPVPARPEASHPLADNDDDAWCETRSGAYSSRGFHYQDVVGAWVCARMLSGSLESSRLIPEGLEDLSVEGDVPLQVQVKSRLERRGPFRANEAAGWVQTMLEKWLSRPGQLILVTERPIEGHTATGLLSNLTYSGPDDALSTALIGRDIDAALLSRVSTLVLPWAEAHHGAVEEVASSLKVSPMVASLVTLKLRDEVSRCVDANTQADKFADRVGIHTSDARRAASRVTTAVDHGPVDDVLASGVCELLDLDSPLSDRATFYEGVSAQPGHIAAGLATPRPVETSRLVGSLETRRVALATGPSGVGKSTVMWAAAYSMRDVLWFRVRRLNPADATAIARFAREQLPGPASQIGFVVDAVGMGSLLEWDDLLRQLAGIPNVYLLGSCRREDLLSLATLAESEMTEIALDEATAARIHTELIALGATTIPHWKEAYDAADGLTMEFTHFLARGRRMESVLGDQVNRYVQEANDGVLRVLALSASAHHWGAGLRVEQLADAATDEASLRKTLNRLHKEHLVVFREGIVTGLHPLRSKTVAALVHAIPPPTLESSLERLILVVDARQLRPLIANAVSDSPNMQEGICRALVQRTIAEPSLAVVTNALHGLQLGELHELAAKYEEVFVSTGVSLSDRAICMQMSLIDTRELLDYVKPEIASAIHKIRGLDANSSPMREAYLTALAHELLQSIARTAGELECLTEFIGLVPATVDLQGIVDTRIVGALGETASVGAVAEFLRTIEDNSKGLVRSLVRGLGGRRAILKRIVAADRTITELPVPGSGPCSAHFLPLSIGHDQQDPRDHAIELAKLLLSSKPDCPNADVRAVAAGEHPIVVGDYEHGISKLDRSFVHSDAKIRRNQLLAAIGVYVAGQPTGTERAETASKVVDNLETVALAMAKLLVGCPLSSEEVEGAERARQCVADAAQSLLPPTSGSLMAADGQLALVGHPRPMQNDPLSLLADGILRPLISALSNDQPNWLAVAKQLHGLQEHARKVREGEPWALLGLTSPPEGIDHLIKILEGLTTISQALAENALTAQAMRAVGGPARDRFSRTVAHCARLGARHRAELVDEIRRRMGGNGRRVIALTQPWASTPDGSGNVRFDVEVADPWDWAALWDELAAALEGVPVPFWTTTTVVPVIGGRAVSQLTARWTGSLWPAPDALRERWPETLVAAWPTPLTSAVDVASATLQTISSIHYLRYVRGEPDLLEDCIFREKIRLAEEVDVVGRYTEEVARGMSAFIAEQVGNVDLESHAKVKPGTLAEAMALGGMGNRDGIFEAWTECRMIAMQFDVSPKKAAETIRHPRLLGVGRMIWQLRLGDTSGWELDVSKLPSTPGELIALQRSKPSYWEPRSMLGTVVVGLQPLADAVEQFREKTPSGSVSIPTAQSTDFARLALTRFSDICDLLVAALGDGAQERARGPRGFMGDVDRLAAIAYSVWDVVRALLAWFEGIRGVNSSDPSLREFLSALDRWAQKALEDILRYVAELPAMWEYAIETSPDSDDASPAPAIDLTIQLTVDPDAEKRMLIAARAVGIDLGGSSTTEDQGAGHAHMHARV